MRRIRLLYVIGELSTGGTELQLLELARKLEPDVFQVLVVSFAGVVTPLVIKYRQAGVGVILLDKPDKGSFAALWKLAQIIRNFRPDIVQAFAYTSRAVIPVSKIFSKSKIIVSIRTNPGWQVEFWDKVMNFFADLILTNSQDAKNTITKYWPSRPCEVVHNGLDVDHYLLLDHSKLSNVPPNANMDSACRKIGLVARLEPVKQVGLALEAFSLLSKNMKDIQLWIVGKGSQMGELMNMQKQLDLENKVVFWGERDDIAALLRFCSIGISSSKVEGFSNAIIEYMASGLPVVVTDVGGNKELVVHGNTGLLVPFGNTETMSNTMLFLLKNPDVARRLGEKGRQRIEEKFKIEQMVSKTESIYRELVVTKH